MYVKLSKKKKYILFGKNYMKIVLSSDEVKQAITDYISSKMVNFQPSKENVALYYEEDDVTDDITAEVEL